MTQMHEIVSQSVKILDFEKSDQLEVELNGRALASHAKGLDQWLARKENNKTPKTQFSEMGNDNKLLCTMKEPKPKT